MAPPQAVEWQRFGAVASGHWAIHARAWLYSAALATVSCLEQRPTKSCTLWKHSVLQKVFGLSWSTSAQEKNIRVMRFPESQLDASSVDGAFVWHVW